MASPDLHLLCLPETKSTHPAKALECVTADTHAGLIMAMAPIHRLEVTWAEALCWAGAPRPGAAISMAGSDLGCMCELYSKE